MSVHDIILNARLLNTNIIREEIQLNTIGSQRTIQ